MPNRYQVAFAASFVGTLLLLVLLTELVKAKLHQRGIYLSDLILLLFLWRPIMEELASALPVAGANYAYLSV